MYRISNGKIVEESAFDDTTAILNQVGAYTPPWLAYPTQKHRSRSDEARRSDQRSDDDQLTVLFDDHGYRDLLLPLVLERRLLRVTHPILAGAHERVSASLGGPLTVGRCARWGDSIHSASVTFGSSGPAGRFRSSGAPWCRLRSPSPCST